MTTLTVGPFSTTGAVEWSESSGVVSASGVYVGDDALDALLAVRLLDAMAAAGRPEAVTWDALDGTDGWYLVENPASEPVDGADDMWAWAVDLRRVPARELEEQLSGAVRSNDHSIASANSTPWHAVPSTATAYRVPSLAAGAAFTRTGSTGAVKVYTPASQALYDAFPTYLLDPSDANDMTPDALIDGYQVLGPDHPNLPAAWLLDNGLLQVRPGASCLLELRRWIPGSPGAWGSWIGVEVGHVASGPTWDEAPTVATTVRVERSSPIETVLVLTLTDTISSSPVGYRVSLRLRRGSRLVRCQIDVDTALNVGVRPDTTVARTDITGAVHQTANNADGDRLVFCVPQAYTSDSGTMTTRLTTAGTHIDVGIGLEVAGSSSVEPDRVADLKAQYYAGQALLLGVI